jgi:acetyl-CoA C-acetyltransferase
MSVCIYGVGSSFFGKQPTENAHTLAWRAVIEAFQDASVDTVDAVCVGTVFGAPGVAQRILQGLGIERVPVLTIENACASGTSAFHEAKAAIELGRYRRVLVLGVEHMSSLFKGAIVPEMSDAEGYMGMALPAIYAMVAQRYMQCFGVTAEQLARISVKNHRHALENPRAQFRGHYTIDEVLSSRMIADPLTLLQSCAISDGAAAAILGEDRRNPRDVRIRSSVLLSGKLWDYRDNHAWGFEIVQDAAHRAYEQASISPADANLFEVHDAFTIGEIVSIEALGLVEEGEGAYLVDSGHTTLGGKQPVNPSGGLLARGHPLGSTGVAQIMEAVWQLRGEAGARQIPNARLAVVETMGGGASGLDGNACVVTVLGN